MGRRGCRRRQRSVVCCPVRPGVRCPGAGARARPADRTRRQHRLHRRGHALRLRGHRRRHAARARAHRAGTDDHRFRGLHRRPVLRRHGPGHPVTLGSRPGRGAGEPELSDLEVDAVQGRPLRPELRPPGLQLRGPVHLLGRAGHRGQRRRPGPDRGADPRLQAGGHHDPVQQPGHLADLRGRPDGRRAHPAERGDRGGPRRGRGARVRRLRVRRGVARALPRSQLGPGQGPRDPVQHRGRDQDGAGRRRDALGALVRMPRRGLGAERPAVRRPGGR